MIDIMMPPTETDLKMVKINKWLKDIKLNEEGKKIYIFEPDTPQEILDIYEELRKKVSYLA